MNKAKNTFENYPVWLITKWQEIADLLAELLCIPAALIMKKENEFMEVFISSKSENNPYHAGDKEKWHDLYCETVIKTQYKLSIPNATKDKNWNKNPDIKLGMIAYLGFPINFPDNQPFGTLCVLDNKERQFTLHEEKLLLQFKNIIEFDLALNQTFDIKTNELAKTLNEQQLQLSDKNSELQKAKEKAEDCNRLKLAFLLNISHEIRTPMNGILGFSTLLNEPGLDGEEQQEYIELIKKSGTRMLNTIDDIISISMIESGVLNTYYEETNINEQINFIYTFFKPKAEKKGLQLLIKKALSPNVAIIKTDKEKVHGVLTNLIKNAIMFTDEGKIEFGCRTISSATGHPLLEFFVKDTGIGIPEDRREAIFERFIKVDIENKRALQGTGLGLSISKAYIQMLGGRIWVESEVGKGSIFYFTIPDYKTQE